MPFNIPFFSKKDEKHKNFEGIQFGDIQYCEQYYNQAMADYETHNFVDALGLSMKLFKFIMPIFFEEHPDNHDDADRKLSFGPFFNTLDLLGRSLRAMDYNWEAMQVFNFGYWVAERKDTTGSWCRLLYSRIEGAKGRDELKRKLGNTVQWESTVKLPASVLAEARALVEELRDRIP